MKAVRTQRWKLIRYPRIDHTQLLDLEPDPHETNNLARDPAQAGRIRQLTALLRVWQDTMGQSDPLRVPNAEPEEIDLTGHERVRDPGSPRGSSRSISNSPTGGSRPASGTLQRLVALAGHRAGVLVDDVPVRTDGLVGLVAPVDARVRQRHRRVVVRVDVHPLPAQVATALRENSQARSSISGHLPPPECA